MKLDKIDKCPKCGKNYFASGYADKNTTIHMRMNVNRVCIFVGKGDIVEKGETIICIHTDEI